MNKLLISAPIRGLGMASNEWRKGRSSLLFLGHLHNRPLKSLFVVFGIKKCFTSSEPLSLRFTKLSGLPELFTFYARISSAFQSFQNAFSVFCFAHEM